MSKSEEIIEALEYGRACWGHEAVVVNYDADSAGDCLAQIALDVKNYEQSHYSHDLYFQIGDVYFGDDGTVSIVVTYYV